MTPFDPTAPLPAPGRRMVLQASAGTGKTTAIAGLVARYVAEGAAVLPQLMIATFSGASSRELRARVREQLVTVEQALAAALAGLPAHGDQVATHLAAAEPAELRRRLGRVGDALAGFDAATICTTHQFCQRMLAELGVLVDHEPGTTLVDDLSDVLDQCVADEYVARYADTDRPPFSLADATRIARHAADRSPTLELAPWDVPEHDPARERVSFAAAVRQAVEARKRRLGRYTFDDMQTRLRDALTTAPTRDQARALLQQRYPVVLIDEFQDTDPVQWAIVRSAFEGRSTVVLIGDPKQSIYGFRGADVLAYLDAVEHGDRQVLATNHRSSPALVAAVGRLLDGARLGDPRIRVEPVASSPEAPRLVASGPWRAPLRLREAGAALPRAAVDADLVADVTALLGSGALLERPRTGEPPRPVAPRDVAVIVATNRRGEQIRARLAAAGVPTVFNGSSSVLSSVAGDDWRALLTAFERPRTREMRAVTLTDFVGWSPARLATASDADLGQVTQLVRGWHAVATQQGFAALFEAMTATGDLAARILSRKGGDRVLTDLRHVADLLQRQQSGRGVGLAGLLDWLLDQRGRGDASVRDERSRRLETDADAVQVMTTHQAKGLQFPVVYLPEVTESRPRTDDGWAPQPFQVHLPRDGRLVRALDVGGPRAQGAAARRAAHDREEAGEDLRELYVALTRAECHLVVWWVPGGSTPRSALHRVLFGDPALDTVPDEVALDGRAPSSLGRLAGSGIAFEPVGGRQAVPVDRVAPPLVPAAELRRTVDHAWRRTSYSALTASAHHDLPDLPLADEPPDPDDAVPPETLPGDPAAAATASAPGQVPGLDTVSPMADLPGGVAFGSLVHAVFEHFDPGDPASLRAIVATETARLPVADVTTDALVTALGPALDTPLGPLFGGRRLRDVAAADRLPELDFELPLGRGRPTDATLPLVADLLATHLGDDDLLAAYPGRLADAGLGDVPLRGFLTGSIDAAIRVDDAVVVVDYKTNRLAPPHLPLTLGHYTPEAMAEAMMASHYPLQALLYSVALHRFLRWRRRGYDPARHLGGIAYLFVRGMAGPGTPVVDGTPTGVFTWRPAPGLVTDLSDLLAGGAP